MSSKKKNTPVNIAKFKEEYDALTIAWHTMLSEVGKQLNYLLDSSGVLPSFPIQKRLKTWSSINEKFERTGLSIGKISDLQDVVGFRLVLQFQRDVDIIQDKIANTFKVVKKYNTLDRLKEDQFGYSSTHFVVEVPEAWLAVPTMASLGGLLAEIQVRTTAQHIWATASQTLQYKSEASVPPQIRRAVYRMSALLEFVDLELERVLSERETYKIDIGETKSANEALNVDLVEQVLNEYLPAKNKNVAKEMYATILGEFKEFGINNRQELVEMLTKHMEQVMVREANAVKENKDDMMFIDDDTEERLNNGVFFSHTGLIRQAIELEFGQKYSKYLRESSSDEDD